MRLPTTSFPLPLARLRRARIPISLCDLTSRRETRWEPKSLAELSGDTESEPQVSCGFTHTSVLFRGRLWSFGKGGGGRLGCGRDTDVEFPNEVLFPEARARRTMRVGWVRLC